MCRKAPVLPGMCGAATQNIWMTLMKGEKWNNQRSQPFSLDTDVYTGRGRPPAAQPGYDLTLRFNTFLSPFHSSYSFIPSVAPVIPPTYLCPQSPLAWLQLKGKCSSGEVRCFQHDVWGPIKQPWPPNILLVFLLFILSFIPICIFFIQRLIKKISHFFF